eukprot:4712584-Karenia_brevis.AAC.1
MLGHIEAMLGHVGSKLEHVEAIVGHFSDVWAHLDVMLGHLGAILGRFVMLEASVSEEGSDCQPVEKALKHIAVLKVKLEPSWAMLVHAEAVFGIL